MADGSDVTQAQAAGLAIKQRIVALGERFGLTPPYIFTFSASYRHSAPVPYASPDRTPLLIEEVEGNLRDCGALNAPEDAAEWADIKQQWLELIPENKAPEWRKAAAAKGGPDEKSR